MKQNYNINATFKYVTTRKTHKCEGCQKTIPKASRVLYDSGRVMGWWFKEWFCKVCDLDRIDSIPDEELRKKLLKERG